MSTLAILWFMISRPLQATRIIRAEGPEHPRMYLALKAAIGVLIALVLAIAGLIVVSV